MRDEAAAEEGDVGGVGDVVVVMMVVSLATGDEVASGGDRTLVVVVEVEGIRVVEPGEGERGQNEVARDEVVGEEVPEVKSNLVTTFCALMGVWRLSW